jgi:hypothetical protein
MPRKTRNCKGSRRRRGTRRLRGGDKAPEVNVGDKFTQEIGRDRYGYVVTDVKNKGREVHAQRKNSAGDRQTICITWRPRSNRWVNKLYTPKDEQHVRYVFGRATEHLDPHF